MAVATAAPATHTQPSRKTKRAWRKNIDLRPVEAGIDAAREQYRETGGTLFADAPPGVLYGEDTTADNTVQQRYDKDLRKLKVDQVLEQRSKVPALESRKLGGGDSLKRKRETRLDSKERGRLWKLANSGGHAANHSAENHEPASHDPWAAVEVAPVHPDQSFLEEKMTVREPDTFRHAPLPLTASKKTVPNVPRPHAGRSYNPKFEAWSELLEQEGIKEVEAERLRAAEAAKQFEKEERAAIAAAEADREEEERAVMSEHESDWEGFQSEMDETQLRAKRPERKTPAERNKIKRRKATEALERHQNKMKLKEKQEKQIDAIRKAAEKENQQKLQSLTFDGFSSDEESDDGEGQERVELAKRSVFGKKFRPLSQDLELVLPDELQESLRLLRPEGNLLKDRYRTMVLQGRTEGRTPLPMQKQPKRKETEKWSYKDWTLEKA